MQLLSWIRVVSLGEAEPVVAMMAETDAEVIMDVVVLEIMVEMILFDFVPYAKNIDNYHVAFECLSLRQGPCSLLLGFLPSIAPDFPHVAAGERRCTKPAHDTGASAEPWTS